MAEEVIGNDRKDKVNNGNTRRKEKEENVRKRLSELGIKGRDVKAVYADGAVAALITAGSSIIENIARDADVAQVVQDVSVQMVETEFLSFSSKPTMQGGQLSTFSSFSSKPTMQEEYFSKPIMQNELLENPTKYDINKATLVPDAITKSGGPYLRLFEGRYIWMLDTGVDPNNPYLVIERDPAIAKSFVSDEPDIIDRNGHGTHCASLAAATRTGFGIAGVAPGATIVPLKVLNANGEGSWSGIIDALNHVAQYGKKGDIVNMSFGAWDASFTASTVGVLAEIITQLGAMGIQIVMSAGNVGEDASHNLPGLIDGPNLFTVTSTNNERVFSLYANFNANGSRSPIDMAIPGERVIGFWKDGMYRVLSGTSMSAAIMSGILYASDGAPTTQRGTIKDNSFNRDNTYEPAVVNRTN